MKTQNIKHLALLTMIAGVFQLITSCRKMIEIDSPINLLVAKDVYKTNSNAAAVLTGIYTDMSMSGIFNGGSSISRYCGLSADELVDYVGAGQLNNYLYLNALTNQGDQIPLWRDLYAYIYRSNAAIEGLTASPSLSPAVKSQLLGEARFIRAFMYFYLVNLYGDVPLLTTTYVQQNFDASRTDKAIIYQQIISDLIEARNEINNDYVSADAISPTSDKLRPNKAVVTALLARVYLYRRLWKQAEEEASRLLSGSPYRLEPLDKVFSINSLEAIWQLQPVFVGFGMFEADVNVLAGDVTQGIPAGPISDPNGRGVYLSKSLTNSFTKDDLRKSIWMDSVTVMVNNQEITYPYSYKYKDWLTNQVRSQYLTLFRLGEQYLIRAEARAELGKLDGEESAEEDLNVIRSRAGLSGISVKGVEELKRAILEERRRELFLEFGHRWFDLKRSEKIDQVMLAEAKRKGGEWLPYKALYPLPNSDIQRNPSLRGHQNPGYSEN